MCMFRSDFPVFSTYPDLIYLDSASTAQKPFGVIEGISDMMQSAYANIHRGSYDLSEKAEAYYEASKEKLAQFL